MPLADAGYVNSNGRPDHAALIDLGPGLAVGVSPLIDPPPPEDSHITRALVDPGATQNSILITHQAHLARSSARIGRWGGSNGRRTGPKWLHDAMSLVRIRFPRRCGAWNMWFVRDQEQH